VEEIEMLKVWGRRSSFNVQKVMWLIGELGLAHEHIDAGGAFGGLDTPAFLAMNPHGRIPVIRDELAAVWESHAILRYLAARDSAGRFWSDDPVARAAVDRWMDWSQTSLQPDFLVGVFWGFYRTPEDKRNWPAIQASLARCTRHFEKLERLLEQIPSCSAIRCRLPILLPARRCTGITNWKSIGRRFPRWNAGIARCSNAKHSGSTS
jgi:glutathione S-transferase